MTNRLEYTPKGTYIIEVTEAGDRFLFLFFIYMKEEKIKWRLTSKIKRIKISEDKVLFTTLNSHYHLHTIKISYEVLSFSEFLYCKKGHTPDESRVLVKKKD